jgi:hypothetical protein
MAVVAQHPSPRIPPRSASAPPDTRALRIILAARGRTQQDLARALKINVATLSRLFNGKLVRPDLWPLVWRAALDLSSEDER